MEIQTVFKTVAHDLNGLLSDIDKGDIALPEIQRPFVWDRAKVRDLFDSMYKGFPIGYLLFWENLRSGAKQIGVESKQHIPRLLVVDGQQRLTSLYSVLRGKPVLDEEYSASRIQIAFRPRDGRFDVPSAAIFKDPEYVPDISEMWCSGKPIRKIINSFVDALKAKKNLSEDEEDQISHNLDRLFDLQKYPFTALEITSSVPEEEVANIFVRINSQGAKLNESDFILTLLSVFAEDVRKELETHCLRCRQPQAGNGPSPHNHFIDPSPDQLLRVAIALGFHRGKLRSVYQILRGKDPASGEINPDRRDEQFDLLRRSTVSTLDLTPWHQFFGAVTAAGYRGSQMISSNNALLYSYAIYLLGREELGLDWRTLDNLIARWFSAVSLTRRYSGSPETVVEADLADLLEVREAQSFVSKVDSRIAQMLTGDFWEITLPNMLAKAASRSPAYFGYLAAQVLLGTSVLFSEKRIADTIDPVLKRKKSAVDKHHLFPRAWLRENGITETRQINQIANFALLEWPDNIDISKLPPREYVPQMRKRYGSERWIEMHHQHALPEGWEEMDYPTFLEERRRLMAALIRQAFDTLPRSTVRAGRA